MMSRKAQVTRIQPSFLCRVHAQYICYCLALLVSIPVVGQKQLVQIKTFDQQLQPYKNIEISINGQDYISMGNKAVVIVGLSAEELPVRSIQVKDDKLEAASWNHSKGTLEIIIRQKSYQLIRLLVKNADDKGLANLKITFKANKNIHATTNAEGYAELPLPLDAALKSTDQFIIENYKLVNLQQVDGENILTVDQVPAPTIAKTDAPVAAETPLAVREGYFKDFDLSKLDSIQSLTVFYAIFKNYEIEEMSEGARRRIDAKFNELVGQLQDSIRAYELSFIGKISDTSFVEDDIKNLLAQARMESRMLVVQQDRFDRKIELINDKLAAGFENLSEDARTELLADLTLLEKILMENESRFYKNQSNYRQIINSLKERFFDLENLEDKLSASEAQRLKEQRIFRQRLLAVSGVVAVFAILIILLIYFSNKLKQQKRELVIANAEVKRINENLEGIVAERTKLLKETNKELDTVLYRASHDLRSPVRSIIGLCNIASSLSNGESQEVLDKVVQTTVEMDKLLKKLSIISEINQPSNFSPVVMTEMVERVQGDFNQIIQDHKIKFVINCPPGLTIHSYPNLVEVILANLMENALFYSIIKDQKHSEIQLTAEMKDQHLELIMLDNGIGVEDTIRDRLFDMFFKGSEKSKGNGLGLYIVRKSVHALQGRVVVESKPGQFAKFVVQLPLNGALSQSIEPEDQVMEVTDQ